MQSDADQTANQGRRRFVKQAAAAGLLTAVASRFPVAYGKSPEQPCKSLKRTVLVNGKFATPAPQWVRVVGGWTEFQFAERRMPTLDEINAVAPVTPESGMVSDKHLWRTL